MNIRKIILCTAPLLLVAGIAYGSLGMESRPDYVSDAVASVSSKMSNSYGMSKCKASPGNENSWSMICMTEDEKKVLNFSVMSSEKAPYDVPTSYYLVANNNEAKKASGEGLLSLLMINTEAKP